MPTVKFMVVDVGNTRIKWGRCSAARVESMVALPHDDESTWSAQLDAWPDARGRVWALAGTDPEQRDNLRGWLESQGQSTVVIDSHRQVPIKATVELPEKVGLDRLLNAVAARSACCDSRACVVIGAGTAITVDIVEGQGAFRGGAILPGFRLMAQALHEYTARLPLIDRFDDTIAPADNTAAAIGAGIRSAIVGGVERLVQRWADERAALFLTGGDADQLASEFPAARVWPEMTLEGLRLTATL